MDQELRLLSQLIQALNEPAHPGLQRLRELLDHRSPDPVTLRGLCQLLMATAPDEAPLSALRCRWGARIVLIALDHREGRLPPREVQRRLQELCRIFRLHGMKLPEAFAALLGARWLLPYDASWSMEMAWRAERIFQDARREAALQGQSLPELQEGIRAAQQLIREILQQPAGDHPSGPAPSTLTPPPDVPPAPPQPLRPAKLFLASFVVHPDTHPHAGDLQFLDPQSTHRLADDREVWVEALEIGGRIYRPYVEKDADPLVNVRVDQVLVLRVEGDSMRGIGIEPGDLILAQRVPNLQARDPSFWTSLEGKLVLAVLSERYQTEAHQAFLIKRLARRRGGWELHAENPAYEAIPLTPGLHELHPVLAILKPTD